MPKTKTLRRGLSTAVTGLMAATVLAACGSEKPEAAAVAGCDKSYPVKVQTYGGNIIDMLEIVAKEKGFFKENCVGVTETVMVNAPDAIKATLTGRVNVVPVTAENVVAARNEGINLAAFTGELDRGYYSLVVRKSLVASTYKKTLENIHTVGMLAIGAAAEHQARLYWEAAGLNPNKFTPVAVGDPASSLAALQNGKVDALQAFGTTQDIAVAKGYGVIVCDMRKPPSSTNPVSPEMQEIGKSSLLYGAQESWLKDNPEAVKRFKESLSESAAWIQNPANRQELYKILEKDIAVPQGVANAQDLFHQMIDIYAAAVEVDIKPEDVQPGIDFALKSLNIKPSANVGVDSTIWKDAS